MKCLILILYCLLLTTVFTQTVDQSGKASDEISDEEIVEDLANENQKFSASMYKQMNKIYKGNLVFSPLSAQWTLSLISEGTAGKMEEELASFLNFPTEAIQIFLTRLHNIENKLVYNSANRIFVRNDILLNKEFASTAEEYYKTTVENADFRNKTAAAKIMNRWIKSQILDQPFNPVEPSNFNRHTNMMFMNVIYLNATWENLFFKSRGKFFDADKRQVNVSTLEKTGQYNYYESKNLDAKFLEFPYTDTSFFPENIHKGLSMVIVLPNQKDGLPNLEENINEVFKPQQFKKQLVYVQIPQFSSTLAVQLDRIFKNLGIKKMFSKKQADFSRLAYYGSKRYYVVKILQEVHLGVNKKGSAAYSLADAETPTRALQLGQSMYEPKVKFIADHPFIYYIQREGVVLFAGRVTDM